MSDATIIALNREYQGAIKKGSEVQPVERVPTGIVGLDLALGGGLPKGRFSLFAGNPSTGKTSLALKCAAWFTTVKNKSVWWVDAEHTFDPEWAEQLGNTLENMYIVDVTTAEEAYDIVERALTGGLIDDGLIVLDSIPAFASHAEYGKDYDERTVAVRALVFNNFCRRIVPLLAKHRATFIGIQHYKTDIQRGFVRKVLPAGSQQRYSSSIIVELNREPLMAQFVTPDKEKKEERQVGIVITWEIVKAKVYGAREGEQGTVDFYTDRVNGLDVGMFDNADELLRYAVALGVITRGGGGNYVLHNGEIVKGKEKLRLRLLEDVKLFEEVLTLVSRYNIDVTNYTPFWLRRVRDVLQKDFRQEDEAVSAEVGTEDDSEE